MHNWVINLVTAGYFSLKVYDMTTVNQRFFYENTKRVFRYVLSSINIKESINIPILWSVMFETHRVWAIINPY